MCILAAPSPHPTSRRILQDKAPRTCKTVALGQAPKYSLARHSHISIDRLGVGGVRAVESDKGALYWSPKLLIPLRKAEIPSHPPFSERIQNQDG